MSVDVRNGQADRPADAAEPAEAAPEASERAIARNDLEAVIRRAVELSLAERDADERLGEEEVVRIATELGLPARLARQALFEMPALTAPARAFDGMFGNGIVSASRALPGDAELLRDRMEDYLSTYEYLRPVRRKAGRLLFVPAEDTLSSLARGLLRPRTRYHLSRARRVVADVRALDEKTTHIQLATDFDKQRRGAIEAAFIGGAIVAITTGGLGALLGHAATAFFVQTPVPEVVGFVGGAAAGLWGTLKLAGRRFRQHMLEAKVELEGLLDRAEHGDRLEPPSSPWRRRLQQRMQGR